ncbi:MULTISPECIES: hypothetical protein [Vibrio]|uniref:hypothetical protein n=1 Tax=Vibrio TaxID=662 RepID=UPI00148D4296|nr:MULTISPECIES: hypothetical protein [Vibrio]ELE6590297.1 hypothetical protein [Vibrio alginolyticus]MDW1770186.1 hypothetical protein [Vibrio sp. Vb2532]NOI16566.1 hypothetical protein [Vibrio hepatarius]
MNTNGLFGLTLLSVSTLSFAATTTIECTYTKYSDPEGLHETNNDFVLRYLLDPETNKAYVLGNNGSNEVAIINGSDQVTFVEATGTGNIMTTTITDSKKTVHSRNTVVFGGELIPSQYYGHCVQK